MSTMPLSVTVRGSSIHTVWRVLVCMHVCGHQARRQCVAGSSAWLCVCATWRGSLTCHQNGFEACRLYAIRHSPECTTASGGPTACSGTTPAPPPPDTAGAVPPPPPPGTTRLSAPPQPPSLATTSESAAERPLRMAVGRMMIGAARRSTVGAASPTRDAAGTKELISDGASMLETKRFVSSGGMAGCCTVCVGCWVFVRRPRRCAVRARCAHLAHGCLAVGRATSRGSLVVSRSHN